VCRRSEDRSMDHLSILPEPGGPAAVGPGPPSVRVRFHLLRPQASLPSKGTRQRERAPTAADAGANVRRESTETGPARQQDLYPIFRPAAPYTNPGMSELTGGLRCGDRATRGCANISDRMRFRQVLPRKDAVAPMTAVTHSLKPGRLLNFDTSLSTCLRIAVFLAAVKMPQSLRDARSGTVG
jgi:hypothetical protein